MNSGDAPAERSWWKRLLRWLRDIGPVWVATVIAVLAYFGGNYGPKVLGGSGKTVTNTVTVGQAKAPATAYLSDLQPTAGDTPMRGDTQIGDQDFRHSIFYDNIPSNQSNASACQNVADPTCRATDYSIATARYHHFSAMLSVTDAGCSGDTAHWSLKVDSTVVKSGSVQVNGSPQSVSYGIPSGNSLALLVSSSGFSGAACGGVDIVWGNAQLR